MSIQKIETLEYTCEKCGHKWTNRTNGKDLPIPKRCAKCKKESWNRREFITSKERGLRRRVRGFGKLYHRASLDWLVELDPDDYTINWSTELTERFLALNPRPTIQELKPVVYPSELLLEPLNSQNQLVNRGFVPDPEEKGALIRNPKEYMKLRKKEAERRQETMQHIIQSRSI